MLAFHDGHGPAQPIGTEIVTKTPLPRSGSVGANDEED
jgi:hypothetical protein